jgi:hypothetical protein
MTMASIRITDLDDDIELDRAAMQEIIGGRGPQQRHRLGLASQSGLVLRSPHKQLFSRKPTQLFDKN